MTDLDAYHLDSAENHHLGPSSKGVWLEWLEWLGDLDVHVGAEP